MENFSEFENQINAPEKNSSSIISYAYNVYKGTFLYVIIAIVIMFVVSSIVSYFTSPAGYSYQEILEQIKSGNSATPIYTQGMGMYYGVSGLVNILLSPLFIGLLYIFNKFNSGEKPEIGDLFIGYKQNTLNIMIYSVVSGLIMAVSVMLCVLPFFFVAPLLMLGGPILLFENASFSDALSKSYQIAKENYSVFIGATLLGILISISGLLLCGIGVILTMYFYFAVMYALYVAYVGKPKAMS